MVLLVLSGCVHDDKKSIHGLKSNDTLLSRINISKTWTDTTFKKLKCGLFINKQGDIAFQDFDKGATENDMNGNVYITNAFTDKGNIALKDIVDTNSLQILNPLYFKDRNRVFFFNDLMEGGYISQLDKVDVESFQTYKDTLYWFGFDKKGFFEKTTKLTKSRVKELGLKREME